MEDWRLTNQMKYLYKKTLMRVSFLEYPEKDHEHCSFCWEKFSRLNETLKEGYCTEDAKDWVCDKCFDDFKEKFEWTVRQGITTEKAGEKIGDGESS